MEWLLLAAPDVAGSTGLGQYTSLASMGVVAIIGFLLIIMVTKLNPAERKAERSLVEKISESHDAALELIGTTLRAAVKESSELFAKTLREYREEQALRDNAERLSRDAMLKASDDKVDRLAHSFQDLALTLGDVMQSLAIPNHSASILKRRREPAKPTLREGDLK